MISIDEKRYEVYADGKEIKIAPKEFGILQALMGADGFVLSRDAIANRVWPLGVQQDTRTIDQHVARLRRKLGPARRHIETVATKGYKFRA